MEARAGHAAYDAVDRPHHAHLHHADAASDAHRDRRHSRHAGIATCASSRPTSAAASARKCRWRRNTSLLVWLARKLKSSVAWTEDRRENLIAGFHSREQTIALQGAFDQRRKVAGAEGRHCRQCRRLFLLPDDLRRRTADGHGGIARPLRRAAIPGRARGVATNTCTMAPYRGVSRPVITFALERLMDKAAAAFKIDPIDIRRRNLIDKFPYTSATGLVFDEASYRQTLEMAVKAIDVPAFRARQKAGARARAVISASALPRSPSAPATAARPLPRAAWKSRPAGRTSSSPSIHPASSRRASAPRRTARACAQRSRRSSPTRSA